MNGIKLNAHAKLNLSLKVVGKRSDGYHNIVSLMQGIDLCDVVEIKKCAENGTKYNLPHCTICGLVVYLCTDEKTIPADINNLALQGIAAVLNAAQAGSKQSVKSALADSSLVISIDKKLPVAAGIAGGSGNAAAAMLGINALTDYPFTLRELMEMGSRVGADVPFSILMNAYRNRERLSGLAGLEEARDAAWMSGTGDIVEPSDPLPRYVIMANPGISVSTRDAYAAIDEIGYESGKRAGADMGLFTNDMEKYTLSSYPEAAELKSMMEAVLQTDEIVMSGSGPTMAAYYTGREKAESDAIAFIEAASRMSGWRVWLTATGL